MTSCPKCRNYRISGPHYLRSPWGDGDALAYRCMQCGYVQEEPCADSDEVAKRTIAAVGGAK